MNHANLPRPGWALFLTLVALACWPREAAAHAEHYSQSAYLTIEPVRVTLELDLSPGANVSRELASMIDKNGDHQIDEAEGLAYASSLLADLSLAIDGQARALAITTLRYPPPDHLATGEDKMSFVFTATFPALEPGPHTLRFWNGHHPVQSVYMANTFTQTKEISLGKQTRDEPQQLLSVDYRIAGGRDAAPSKESAPRRNLGSLARGLGFAAALGALFAWSRRRPRPRGRSEPHRGSSRTAVRRDRAVAGSSPSENHPATASGHAPASTATNGGGW